MAILEVRNLNKYFGEYAALWNVNFTLERGEALAIIGASGSGKTTLLRCLNFLETPDLGEIIVKGETIFDAASELRHNDAWIRKKRLHFGLVFQSFNLFPQYTALRNVTIAPELLARGEEGFRANKAAILADIERNATEILDSVGLSDRLGHYPPELSGGQQQRVAIARALALNPDILCFDEPTSALDPELTGEVLKVIKTLHARQTTMIIVTHEMQFAREVADTILFMDEGYVVEQGPPEEVFGNPKEERTRQFLERYSQGYVE
jgi:polar amino acid transport system ATP-binding protein